MYYQKPIKHKKTRTFRSLGSRTEKRALLKQYLSGIVIGLIISIPLLVNAFLNASNAR